MVNINVTVAEVRWSILFDGVEKPIREFERGETYIFDQNDSSNTTTINLIH